MKQQTKEIIHGDECGKIGGGNPGETCGIRQNPQWRPGLLGRYGAKGSKGILGSNLAAAAFFGGRNGRADYAKPTSFQVRKEAARRQAADIREWAVAAGVWHENANAYLDSRYQKLVDEDGNAIEGGEATVYRKDGMSLVKLLDINYFIEPLLALDRIVLHNAIFPEAELRVIGFGMNTDEGRVPGELSFIVEQDFICGTVPTEDEIAAGMALKGFFPYKRSTTCFVSNDGIVVVDDVHDENCLKLPNGNIVCFDSDIRYNTPEVGKGGTFAFETHGKK